MYKRLSDPPAHRMPAPNTTLPPGASAFPCKKMQELPECMLLPVRSTLSDAKLAVPDAAKPAPELPVLAQPTPAPLGLPH
jgi:hypothetical protein